MKMSKKILKILMIFTFVLTFIFVNIRFATLLFLILPFFNHKNYLLLNRLKNINQTPLPYTLKKTRYL
mgnify:CR=1 FL=1